MLYAEEERYLKYLVQDAAIESRSPLTCSYCIGKSNNNILRHEPTCVVEIVVRALDKGKKFVDFSSVP